MLRFAPSPTGDMHIANLRMALFNYILSVQKDEDLVIRIEDTDTEKNIDGKDKEIIGLLDLFGVKYSNVIYQSSNVKHHRTMALSLLHEKIAFNCFCTPSTLEAKKQEAQANKQDYKYDDVCLSLTPEQTIDNETPFTVRLRKPNVDVEFTDLLKGKMSFSPVDIDSFLILNADKSPTNNFACAIDDMLSDISMVIREDDHLSDTPKQIVVRAALNYTKEIKYIHIPVILNASGEKMSKSDAGFGVKWLLEEGYLPEAIINYLLSIGTTPNEEIFSLTDALKWFDVSKVSKSCETFDMDKLRFVNAEHLRALDDVELSRYVGFADADIGKLAKLYLQEVSTTKELKEKIKAIFGEKEIPVALKDVASNMITIIKNAPYFDKYDDFKNYVMKESGLKDEVFFKTLSIILTGSQDSLEIATMYPYLKHYMLEIVK